jgi:pilus assembly protein Flp/PilA
MPPRIVQLILFHSRSPLASLRREEDGQGLAEYALVLALIAVVAIAALALFGDKVNSVLSTVAHSI